MAGSCELGEESSVSMKDEEFLDQLSVLLAYQEGILPMEFIFLPHISLFLTIIRSILPFPPSFIRLSVHFISYFPSVSIRSSFILSFCRQTVLGQYDNQVFFLTCEVLGS
jgi:hypothetical protein